MTTHWQRWHSQCSLEMEMLLSSVCVNCFMNWTVNIMRCVMCTTPCAFCPVKDSWEKCHSLCRFRLCRGRRRRESWPGQLGYMTAARVVMLTPTLREKQIQGISWNLSPFNSPCSEWIRRVLFQRRHLKEGRRHNSMITPQSYSKHLECRVHHNGVSLIWRWYLLCSAQVSA